MLMLVMVGLIAQAVMTRSQPIEGVTYIAYKNTPLFISDPGIISHYAGFDFATHRIESYDTVSQYGGRVVIYPFGAFIYRPRTHFVGMDQFSYTVRTAEGGLMGVINVMVVESGDITDTPIIPTNTPVPPTDVPLWTETYTPTPSYIFTSVPTIGPSPTPTPSYTYTSVPPTPGPSPTPSSPYAYADSYNLTPHLTFTSLEGLGANDDLFTQVTGFGNSLATANATTANGVNFITASGAGGRVVVAPDGTFTYYPDARDVNTTATFYYTMNGGFQAQVTLNITADELVWFVDNTPQGAVCTGSNLGTAACPEDRLTDAALLTAFNNVIFLASGSYTCSLTLLENGVQLIGDGSSGVVSEVVGITPQLGSSFGAYSTFSGIDPVLSSSSDCLSVRYNNTVRGLTVGNTPANRYAFVHPGTTNLGLQTISEVSIIGTGGWVYFTTGQLDFSFETLTSTASTTTLDIRYVNGGTFTVTGAANISAATFNGVRVINSGVQFTFAELNISNVGEYGISLRNTLSSAAFTVNRGVITDTGRNNLYVQSAGNFTLDNMTLSSTAAGTDNHNILALNTTGMNRISNTTIDGAQGGNSGLFINGTNPSTTSHWQLTDVSCTTAADGDACIRSMTTNTYRLNLDVLGTAIGQSVFRSNGDAIQLTGQGNTITQFNMDYVRLEEPVGVANRRGGLTLRTTQNATIRFVIQRSEFIELLPEIADQSMVAFRGENASRIKGRFSNNTIVSTVPGEHSALSLAGTELARDFEVYVLDNDISLNSTREVVSVRFVGDGTASIYSHSVTLQGNTITNTFIGSTLDAPVLLTDVANGVNSVRLLIAGNTLSTQAANGSSALSQTVRTSVGSARFAVSSTVTSNTFNSNHPYDYKLLHTSPYATSCTGFEGGNTGSPPATANFERTAGFARLSSSNLADLDAENPTMTITVSGMFFDRPICSPVVDTGVIPIFPNLLTP